MIGQSQGPLTTHNTHKKQTYMPPARFKPTITARGHRNCPSDCTVLPKVKFSGLKSACLWLSWQHRRILRHVEGRSRYNQQRSGSSPDSWQAAMTCAMCLRESCRLHWLIDRSGRTSTCLLTSELNRRVESSSTWNIPFLFAEWINVAEWNHVWNVRM